MSGSPVLSALAMLVCGRFQLSLHRPLIMGIINVTPDSFSDGGCLRTVARVRQHAELMLTEGADLLDIGGESTRPDATPVSAEQELARVLPALEALAPYNVPLSLDTRKAEVMRQGLATGYVDMINDVCALEDDNAVSIVAKSQAAVCLMHMQGNPLTMQRSPRYHDVVTEVAEYLQMRCNVLLQHAVAHSRIVIDPGFGFGKHYLHNLTLFQRLGTLCRLPWPVLVGMSRKSMLGEMTGRAVEQRDVASAASALLAVQQGASIVRVHNVGATKDALNVLAAYTHQGKE